MPSRHLVDRRDRVAGFMIPDRYLAKWAFAAAMILAPTGCGPEQVRNRSEQEAAYIKFVRDQAYRNCIDGAVGMFTAASIEVVKHCEAKAQEVQP